MDDIFKNAKQKSYIRGDTIPIGQNIFFINQGTVAIYSRGEKTRKLLYIYRQNEVFPYISSKSLFSGRELEYKALDTVFLRSLPRSQFDKEALKPANSKTYVATLLERIDHLMERIDNLGAGSAQQKLILRLIYFAERLGKANGDKVIVDVPMSYSDIAESIGTTRETVNRIIGQLSKKGIINIRQQTITINSLKKLQKTVRD